MPRCCVRYGSRMFRRHKSPPVEHPAVPVIEHILTSAAVRTVAPVATAGDPVMVDCALSLCGCVSFEEAPIWLIYSTADGRVGWRRIDPELQLADVVEATVLTGNHVDPSDLLRWLHGQIDTRALLDAELQTGADIAAVERLGRMVRNS